MQPYFFIRKKKKLRIITGGPRVHIPFKYVTKTQHETLVTRLYVSKIGFYKLFFRFFLFLFHSIPRIHTPIARIPTLISRIHTPFPRIPILISLMPTLIPRISILIPRIHTLILGIFRFPTPISRIPTLIPRIPTLIPRTPTLIPRVLIIPLIPSPDSPFRLLQIALLLTC